MAKQQYVSTYIGSWKYYVNNMKGTGEHNTLFGYICRRQSTMPWQSTQILNTIWQSVLLLEFKPEYTLPQRQTILCQVIKL